MRITLDRAKRTWTLKERGLDFRDAREVFAGPSLDVPDTRFDYGEERIRTVGYLGARLVLVVWTPRGRGPAGDIDEVLQCQRKEALREQNPVR